MLGRIVEIANNNRHLFISRGFMVIRETDGNRNKLGQVPLDDIAAVVANAHGLSYTNNLLVALADRGVPFVLCGANHNPVGMIWPVDGHSSQAGRFDAQLDATKPLRKRLWSSIVKSKLNQQAAALEAAGAPDMPLTALVTKVRSGDPDNIEALGARRYWQLLFGEDFRRDQQTGGLNGLLNYGYTVLRAATARAIIAAGLHPSIGVHHANKGNAMRLADDLMEPYRPFIDLLAWQLRRQGLIEVTPETKRVMVRGLYDDLITESGVTPMQVSVQKLATSLAQVYLGEREQLDLPLPGLPLTMTTNLDTE
ncbi:MAG TPA: type II CRISPR-associated endonuclease Cas1 [Devosia sp.]|nr:type II CRISPR-associated endonuclease Cas1 [Devosia sp.]